MVLSGEDVAACRSALSEIVQPGTSDLLSLDQVTSAPRAVRVSMRTAVWTVLYSLSA